jgi:FMN phosphatase YigB (HAD superfamily)/DNA-binding Xre family transcriptional regulator
MDEKGLGKRLQDARRHSGLTQQQLCQKAGLSYSTLAKIERGAIKSPSIFTIANIASALDTGLDALLGIASPSALPTKRTSKSGVKFVYFDVNGCLVRFAHRGFTRLSEENHVPIDVIETVFWEYDDMVCRGDKTLDELNTILAETLHTLVDWKKNYLEAVEPLPGIGELVHWTREHYYTGLMTNTMPGFVEAMRERGLIPAIDFDAIVDSSQVHALKPEPRIYEAAEEMSGVSPGEILLIDDSRANLVASKHRGWHTIWFDYYRPDETIASIRQALEPAV